MFRCITTLLLVSSLLATSQLAQADFESAANAYRNRDYSLAYAQFLSLAQAGDPRAQTVIAMMHKYGESVALDPEQAFNWYLQAAELGYAPAQFSVGEMYAAGTGVAEDKAAAVQWLRKAAEAGHERANRQLERLNAETVRNAPKSDPSIPWSKAWDLRLPNHIRYDIAPAAIEPETSWRVQLGAMATQAAANRLWVLLEAEYPDMFADVSPAIRLAEGSERRVYRIQAGPFEDFAGAREFCRELERRRVRTGCLPVKD